MSGDSAALLKVAERDATALTAMLATKTIPDEIFGFVAQQAIEKALKAWIASLGANFQFTHDIQSLLDQLEMLGQDVSGLASLTDFYPFAVQLRYTFLDPLEDPLDRKAVIAQVDDLVSKVRKKIA